MSEPVNWIDRIDSVTGWGKRHPFLAKLLSGMVMAVVAVVAIAWRVKTIGHE